MLAMMSTPVGMLTFGGEGGDKQTERKGKRPPQTGNDVTEATVTSTVWSSSCLAAAMENWRV